MNGPIRKFVALSLLAAFALATAACNTMSGLGRDTAAVGHSIEKEAESHIDEDGRDQNLPRSN